MHSPQGWTCTRWAEQSGLCCLRVVDGLTAAKVGAEKAGQKTAWAIALEKKQAEEAVKRDAELAEAHAKQAAAGDDEWDEDWDEDEEVTHSAARAFRYPSRLSVPTRPRSGG